MIISTAAGRSHALTLQLIAEGRSLTRTPLLNSTDAVILFPSPDLFESPRANFKLTGSRAASLPTLYAAHHIEAMD